ncbi:hypothetical protein SG34_021265 [Thalassomonas viridans]|uniref:Uncharacterized protein n=1 Tax=Thalassomonas viridans TaxID=137584 RepID=A0AAE9YZ61_9GAMM|nr:hypothetical protein [Thalassomonas viridans]WDE03881.1 hypothetical protein SG34_021265 [Thalassomonas viridans]
MSDTSPNTRRLPQAIAANALFSFTSGTVFMLARDVLIPHIPLPPLLWTLLGACLIAFSVQLAFMVKNRAWAEKLIVPVILSDIAWVVLTSIALVCYQSQLSGPGIALIVGVNLVVATLAWFQAQAYLKKRTKIKVA